ncbi:hypothetical protein P3T39_001942 [Kitasatospora sp. GP82]|nr:hypothetical protein [Kitasatospora sp. GP82]
MSDQKGRKPGVEAERRGSVELKVAVWAVYLVPTLALFLRRASGPAAGSGSAPKPVATGAESAEPA